MSVPWAGPKTVAEAGCWSSPALLLDTNAHAGDVDAVGQSVMDRTATTKRVRKAQHACFTKVIAQSAFLQRECWPYSAIRLKIGQYWGTPIDCPQFAPNAAVSPSRHSK